MILGCGALVLAAIGLPFQAYRQVGYLALLLACAGLLAWHLRAANEIAQLAERLGPGESGRNAHSPMARLQDSVGRVEERLKQFDDRLNERHGVTGLPTRELLLNRMAADGSGTLGIIAFSNFNRLCALNPALADRALKQFADRITRMVSAERMFAHVDRSHFVLWFGPDAEVAEVEAQLAALSYALGDTLADEGLDLTPETRVHHASFNSEVEPPEHLLARALSARAASAKTQVKVADMDKLSATREHEHFELEQDLRSALSRNEYELRFQPQIDASGGRVHGAEALLRWNSPSRGMVSPSLFVPLLEDAGIIDDAGNWALNAACREARNWQSLNVGGLSVAVNVSSYQLECADLAKRVERILRTHELPARALEIELTETAAASDVGLAAQFFASLRAIGIKSAIDDFGTGYSSLSALRTLPFDKIKIDREFVTEVDSRRENQAICQSIIALARGLGIRVLAEGVERQEEYLWLRKHGCTEFQGYYFAMPLTASEFEAYLLDQSDLRERLALGPKALQKIPNKRLA